MGKAKMKDFICIWYCSAIVMLFNDVRNAKLPNLLSTLYSLPINQTRSAGHPIVYFEQQNRKCIDMGLASIQ